MSAEKFRMLWVYQEAKCKGRPIEAGQKPSLCFVGRVSMICVAAGHPVRVLKRPAADFKKLRPVWHGDGEYSVVDAVAKFQEIGRRNGITEGAKKILARAADATAGELDDDEFINEEDVTMNTVEEAVPTPAEGETTETTEQPRPKKVRTIKQPKEKMTVTTKKVKAPKAKKAPKAAKPKKESKPKVPKEKGDGLGREGSITRFIRERLVKGQDNEVIATAAKKEFPKAKAVDAKTISWYRWKATTLGIIKAVK